MVRAKLLYPVGNGKYAINQSDVFYIKEELISYLSYGSVYSQRGRAGSEIECFIGAAELPSPFSGEDPTRAALFVIDETIEVISQLIIKKPVDEVSADILKDEIK